MNPKTNYHHLIHIDSPEISKETKLKLSFQFQNIFISVFIEEITTNILNLENKSTNNCDYDDDIADFLDDLNFQFQFRPLVGIRKQFADIFFVESGRALQNVYVGNLLHEFLAVHHWIQIISTNDRVAVNVVAIYHDIAAGE